MNSGAPDIMPQEAQSDHQQVVRRIACYEFPFDFTRALEFALFRTFCVPSISRLLDGTGEFKCRAQKRYDDTDLLVSEIVECGYDSERGRAAIERINAIHGRFRISNDDFLYVLSSFIFEPIRWIARFSWRPMHAHERLALFHFWREVGQRMRIHSIPAEYDDFDRFNSDYEQRYFRFTETNQRVGAATREKFAAWFPKVPRPLVRRVIHALLDDTLIEAFGFPRPSRIMCRLVTSSLRLRGRMSGWLPSRRKPRLRTELIHSSYPEGYEVRCLGPSYQRSRQ